MSLSMAVAAKSYQLIKQFVPNVRVGRMMDFLNRLSPATLANSIFSINYRITQPFPLG
jgi:hypothetical protein